MATDFRPIRLITAADLFGGRLEKYGVREFIAQEHHVRELIAEMGLPERTDVELIRAACFAGRCLTDGTNYAWVGTSKRGFVASISRYNSNDPLTILEAIAKEFDTVVISEDEPDYWEDYEGEVVAIPLSEFEKL